MGQFVTIPFDYDDLPSEERDRVVRTASQSSTGGQNRFHGNGLNKALRRSTATS